MNYKSMVRTEVGLVSRSIFVDPGIYERELQNVFGRCWLYLGHESQLPEPDSFFTTFMGADSVVVTRTNEGVVRAFLNSCTHRGMKVCRTDRGKAPHFTCPYHGWCFRNDGTLIGVPGMREAYFNELDRSQWGLREVARLEKFHGLIFATWNAEAPSLRDYLGGMATYLERMVSRSDGGIEMVAGIQKWEIPVNWKMIAENFLGDSYHVPTAHGSVVDIGYRRRPKLRGYQISLGGGHGFGSELGGMGGGGATSEEYDKFLAGVRDNMKKQNDPADQFIPLGHGTVFPNFSFLDNVKFRLVRMSHPRSATLTECHTMLFVDKALPSELRDKVRRDFILSFGPSGMFEVEDGEIWSEVSDGLRGHMSRSLDFNYQMGLGHDKPVSEEFGGNLPGRAGWYWSELNHRDFYRQWRELMEASDERPR